MSQSCESVYKYVFVQIWGWGGGAVDGAHLFSSISTVTVLKVEKSPLFVM